MCSSDLGPGLDRDQTDLDGPWRSQSRSQNFHLGPDCPVSGPAKMAPDRTRPNFPNTRPDHPHHPAGPPTSSGWTTHIVQPDPLDLTGLCLILFMDSRMFSFYNRISLHVLSSSTFYLRLDPWSSILISVTYPCLSDSGSH